MKKIISEISNRDRFLKFMELLIGHLKNNPDEWENKSLLEYLEAVANWTADMDGYYINNNLTIPENVNWQVFANILLGASVYE